MEVGDLHLHQGLNLGGYTVPQPAPKALSSYAGREAREVLQPREKMTNPPPPSPTTICSRSDTHSGLLQAFFFFFSVLGRQRHLLAPWYETLLLHVSFQHRFQKSPRLQALLHRAMVLHL